MLIGPRLVVIGNSGAGKTTLARRIGPPSRLPVHHLDPIRWEGPGARRNDEAARQMVRAIVEEERWIVEGVFGWLAAIALERASDLVWIDLPVEDCRDAILRRHAVEPSPGGLDSLIAWVEGYATRTTSSSFAGHRALYDGFAGRKLRIGNRAALDTFADRHPAGDRPRAAPTRP